MELCAFPKVGFWIHGPREFYPDGTAKYHLSASAITDGNGIASVTKTFASLLFKDSTRDGRPSMS